MKFKESNKFSVGERVMLNRDIDYYPKGKIGIIEKISMGYDWQVRFSEKDHYQFNESELCRPHIANTEIARKLYPNAKVVNNGKELEL
jgi:hypothetical protein